MKSNATSTEHYSNDSQPEYREVYISGKLKPEFVNQHQCDDELDSSLVFYRYVNPVWTNDWFKSEYDAKIGGFSNVVTKIHIPDLESIEVESFMDEKMAWWFVVEQGYYNSSTDADGDIQQPS